MPKSIQSVLTDVQTVLSNTYDNGTGAYQLAYNALTTALFWLGYSGTPTTNLKLAADPVATYVLDLVKE